MKQNRDTTQITNRGAQRSSTDTADFDGKVPVLSESMNLESLLNHLEDARPTVIADIAEDGTPPARYVIGQELGSGSVGQVIEARDQHLGRQVAIKVLHDGEGLSRDGIARFVAEAQITAQLEHPNVVPVHEIGIMPGGMPYFSMKLVKGISLGDLINHLRIGDREMTRQYNHLARLRLFQRICQGVAYAHSKGVVHRDLKPANILIGEYGEVQIMDWGLAKMVNAPVSDQGEALVSTVRQASGMNTYGGAIAGTPAYMSPEQARGDFAAIGPPSDVFALGLMLAEFITLVRVYREPSFNASLLAARHPKNQVDIAKLAPGSVYSQSVDRVVRKATNPEISYRYSNAGEMSREIAQIIEEQLPSSSLKRNLRNRDLMLNHEHLGKPTGVIALLGRAFWYGAGTVLGIEAVIWLMVRLLT
ncbi:MAG: serine/threonine protein kinase [Planctomycetes bacterium]|nr:serine/threonine protein kinase [Planctomycetota bacterium]